MENTDPGTRPVRGKRVLVLGGGMVGVCCALELQARGARVTLIDRADPGRETSYGNAGVLTRSSLVPINGPGLWSDLPTLLRNKSAALRYDARFLARNLNWTAQFLGHAQQRSFDRTTTVLDGLIRLSIGRHRALLSRFGLQGHLSDRGWILLYRSDAAFRKAARTRDAMERHGVDAAALSARDLGDLEPCLKNIFARALWVRDSLAVNNPGAVVEGYAKAFSAAGGQIERAEALELTSTQAGVTLQLAGGEARQADTAVLCLGPWARRFLETAGYRVTMGFERGYHRHFTGRPTGCGNDRLSRPIYDVAGGYVLAPMERGLRLSTGVELRDQAAPPNYDQITLAEGAAREAIALGDPIEDQPWMGSRPTFPDSLPAIGPLPAAPNIWLSFGHQHIGFATGPGSASVLADLIEHAPPPIPAAPFRPARFIQRR